MSLQTRVRHRLASSRVHRTAWRQRGIRYYASETTSEPEWFQPVRTDLLSRAPLYLREELDELRNKQLSATLTKFVPRLPWIEGDVRGTVPLAQLLTRFNTQDATSNLLPDGTDALHSPGETWKRRMWAGGSVQINPELQLKSETPFLVKSRTVCLERIKDVRLQGTGETASVFVTIERRFASVDHLKEAGGRQFGGDARKLLLKQVNDGLEWGNAWIKEERNLVFLPSKTAAEVTAIKNGETLMPKYLQPPPDLDYSHSLTPTRSLLFRYSALTFNAHLLHLDPSYARNVEGHRNVLVQGALTLTLMLQTLNRHLWHCRSASRFDVVDSVEYRNLAPLYCDEEMRICIRKRDTKDTARTWDVWIEGPTGGMAVKAVVRTVARATEDSSAAVTTQTDTRTNRPSIETVAAQARDKERQIVPFSKIWRKRWVGKHLQYLYIWENSALTTRTNLPERERTAPSAVPSQTYSDSPAEDSLQHPASAMDVVEQSWSLTRKVQSGPGMREPVIRKIEQSRAPPRKVQSGPVIGELVIKKIEQVSVRKVVDHGLSDMNDQEGRSRRSIAQKRSSLREAVQAADKQDGAKDGNEGRGDV